MAQLDFDARNIDPNSYEALPEGTYLVAITESDQQVNKAENGSYLKLKLEILDGAYRGRVLFDRLNLKHPNALAVQIAQQTLSQICHAVGVLTPRDSVELHNLPLQINVRVKKRDDNGELTNEIKGYARKEAVAGQPQQSTDNTPPWKRN